MHGAFLSCRPRGTRCVGAPRGCVGEVGPAGCGGGARRLAEDRRRPLLPGLAQPPRRLAHRPPRSHPGGRFSRAGDAGARQSGSVATAAAPRLLVVLGVRVDPRHLQTTAARGDQGQQAGGWSIFAVRTVVHAPAPRPGGPGRRAPAGSVGCAGSSRPARAAAPQPEWISPMLLKTAAPPGPWRRRLAHTCTTFFSGS